jgi:Protein of Unknown function (DUF2784)
VLYRLLADAVVVLHFAFVLFVVLGGLFALRWPRAAWIHLPAAVWGAGIEFVGGICPLTPLEIRLRRLGGEAGYTGGFVEHYILPVLYPEALNREIQYVLGGIVIGLNVLIYAIVLRRWRARRAS